MIYSILNKLEQLGNKLPHPTWLFVYLCGFIIVASAIFQWFGLSATHPINESTITANSLVSRDGLQWVLQNTVKNFTSFAPVGTVLVAIMGLGLAERSGLISAVLRSLVSSAPNKMLSFIVVFSGVLSSLAADAGYVVLIPLAAILFVSAGRSPLLGIAAAFAGVSGGYSANLLIGPLDAILAGISTEAVALVDPSYTVSAAGNYYFIIVSTFLIAGVGTWVTEYIVAPQLSDDQRDLVAPTQPVALDDQASKGLIWVACFSLLCIALLLLGLVPAEGVLRHPDTGSISRSPFISGIVTLIALYAGLAGIIYGRAVGLFKTHRDIVQGMDSSMQTMASYLVLMFFAAQFVNYFKWTDLGIIAAINGADGLSSLGLGNITTLLLFIVLAGVINLLIGSSSAKWALIAPIFVPMFYFLGIAPEATQLAYRIGDSSTNIITPLMPYFGVVVAFAQRYDSKVGIGTIMAMMLPYSIAFMLGWALLLMAWLLMGWPLGPA